MGSCMGHGRKNQGREMTDRTHPDSGRITELESQLAQRFDAADMATAAAQGFRDGAVPLSANAGEPRNAIDRDALIDAIAQGLHGTWHCTRVWEAWHVGTMSQDDFEPVDESETPTEIADAVLALLASSTPQPAPAGATPECLTCSDHGAVGNILTAEPCPDCTRLNTQPAPATQPAQAAEPVAWLDPWTGTKVTTDYDAYGKHGIPLYAAPQPV